MRFPSSRPLFSALCAIALCAAARAGVRFEVVLPESAKEAVGGRVLVYVLSDGAKVRAGTEPADGPFYDDPQPLFGISVEELQPGAGVVVDDGADAFPAPPSALKPGSYRAQAVLEPRRINSQWGRQEGTLFSKPVAFTASAMEDSTVLIVLDQRVEPREFPDSDAVQLVEVRSGLLSDFHGRPVTLRAGVAFPIGFEPGRQYPAVYNVPGFGGDHFSAAGIAMQRERGRFRPGDEELQRNSFVVVLDPEGPNGHNLFADSANNGPVGRALVEELIPAIEERFPLIAEPSARVVRGHSSGGWSAVWLAMQYPEVFGHAFSSSPDPLDFRAFQQSDIYADKSVYTRPDGTEIASNVKDGKVLMTVRQENQWEEVKGPDNTSAEQWDSWQAVFGPRNERGHPAALFDPETGELNREIASRYRDFDIAGLVRSNPEKYAPVFARNIRILVGGADEWNLHEGVRLLGEALAGAEVPMDSDPAVGGSIHIVPGRNHSTIFLSDEMARMNSDMLGALRRSGHVPAEAAP